MATIRTDFYQPRVRQPPSTGSADLDLWLRQVADEVNKLPPFSAFSYDTPNSNVSAQVGTLGLNIASGHTVLWIKLTGASNTGWVSAQTA